MSKFQNNSACLSTTCYTWRPFGGLKCSLFKIELSSLSPCLLFLWSSLAWQMALLYAELLRAEFEHHCSHQIVPHSRPLCWLNGSETCPHPLPLPVLLYCFPTTPTHHHCYLSETLPCGIQPPSILKQLPVTYRMKFKLLV